MDFTKNPRKAAEQLHVSPRDVAQGSALDAYRRALAIEQQKALPMYPSRENAAKLDRTAASRDATFWKALDRGPDQSATESPSRAEQIARAALSGAGSFGGWVSDERHEPTADAAARMAGEFASDPLNAVGLGALKYAGKLAKKALPTAAALGTSAYAEDAEAASRYDPRAVLRYIKERFPEMLPAVKQGMKFTADTGREAGVYGKLDDSLIIQPRLFAKGTSNSVSIPADIRRELIDAPNAFDLHTHPSGNALPSTPLNNASQNPLGGDTEYYQKTTRGTPWLRPGKADNMIVSVQPRAAREPLEFGSGRGESWTHMKMNEYPDRQGLTSIQEYLDKNADRYEGILPMGDEGQMLPDDAGTFALLKHFADTGRGDFNYNLGKEVFGPGGREPSTPMYEAIYEQLRKDKQLRNYAGGGSIAGAAKRLAQRSMPAAAEGYTPSMAPRGALSVVKPKGGNWLNNSVEDALRPLQRLPGVERDGVETFSGMSDANIAGAKRNFVLDDWVTGPLTKYVKTRMASPEDEVRGLAEQGVLHFDPRVEDVMRREALAQAHRRQVDELGAASTPLGKSWETLSDASINPVQARDLSSAERAASFGGKSDVPPDTTVHMAASPMTRGQTLGFDHLIDELSNALNPNSGLPRHLLLSPDAVKNMSMEKAVRRVADINKWRAEQQIAANAEVANKAAMVREYTDPAMPNPKGLRWMELKKGDLPQGWAEKPDELTVPTVYNELGEYVTQANTHKDPRTAELAKQLKYEGDTMGHCVGGYCDDVASGRSRIFSLRDAKGEPHVTVEVGKTDNDWAGQKFWDALDPEVQTQYSTHVASIIDPPLSRNSSGFLTPREHDRWRDAMSAFLKKQHPDQNFDPVQKITQIKGKQNRKPNDEYLPFVQDFVKNPPHGSPWGDVGDLGNTDLRRVTDAFNKVELKKLQEAGVPIPTGYASKPEIEELHRQFNLLTTGTEYNPARAWERMQYDSHIDDLDIQLPDRAAPPEGLASGGSVQKSTPPTDIRGIMNALMEHHAHA
jgi:hypothetical protein